MASALSTGALARASARHPWRVVVAWIVLLVGVSAIAFGGGGTFTSDIEFTNSEEAQIAKDLLERSRGPEPLFEQVIVQSDTRTVDDPQFRQLVESILRDVRKLDGDVEFGTSFYEEQSKASSERIADPARLVSQDRKTALVPIKLRGDIDTASKHVEPVIDVLHRYDGKDGFTVVTAGFASLNHTFETIAERDLQAEQRALPVALVVLLLVFGAVVAAFIPMVLAILAIVLAFAIATLISNAFPLSIFVQNMVVMIGLALGIDYSLFIVQRYREERDAGVPKIDAIGIAGNTAGRAVLFSGATVVISLLGMLIVPTNIFKALGTGAILAAVCSVVIALTLLPAVLALLGDKVDRLAVPFFSRKGHVDPSRGFWARAARVVMANPWPGVIVASLLLIALALPWFQRELGFAGASTFPEKSDSYKAFQILDREFSQGDSIVTEIVVRADDVTAAPVQEAQRRLDAAIANDPAIKRAPRPTDGPSPDRTLLLTTVSLPGEPSGDEALDALSRLREQLIPEAFRGVDAAVYVGGQSAISADFFDVVDRYTPIVFALVLGLSFVLLLMVFRSIVVPVKAIIMNLLSVGAAYGMLVLIFQEGFLADQLGFQQVPTIEAWVPLFLFMILFGLSMDYHVFLLSRIRERYDQTRDNAGSVAFGLRSTANIITGAAAIMVVVFGGFALGDLVMFQQFGFGLAFAVFMDATVVRMILVPAAMELLGDRNWYLPSWLRWLPDLRVEGVPHAIGAGRLPVAGDD